MVPGMAARRKRAAAERLVEDVGAEAVNAELDEAIFAGAPLSDVWPVYADWLDERGDPRGELIRVQSAPRINRAQERAVLKWNRARWFGAQDPEDLMLAWEHGFVDALCVGHSMAQAVAVEQVLSLPVMRLLRRRLVARLPDARVTLSPTRSSELWSLFGRPGVFEHPSRGPKHFRDVPAGEALELPGRDPKVSGFHRVSAGLPFAPGPRTRDSPTHCFACGSTETRWIYERARELRGRTRPRKFEEREYFCLECGRFSSYGSAPR